MWNSSSALSISEKNSKSNYLNIVIKGFMLNILNPKLSIFFLAFIPQFIPSNVHSVLNSMLLLGAVFMIMTFVVFVIYGFLSGLFSAYILKSEKASIFIQRFFATSFAALGLKLAFSERV
jgi:threonine/homoserine/homoserine lactone efflux protein